MPFLRGHAQSNTGRTHFKKGERVSSKTEFKKGHTPWNKGRTGFVSPKKGIPVSEEQKEKIRKAFTAEKRKVLSEAKKGKKNPNWKGGVTPGDKVIRHSLEMKLWRESIFKKNDYTCQKCGERGGSLHPHHIKNFAEFPELRFAIDNGITFCVECHKEFHRKYGIRNNTLIQVIGFMDKTMYEEVMK